MRAQRFFITRLPQANWWSPVSDRDFMDDAAAIMGQEIMLEKVEQDAVVF